MWLILHNLQTVTQPVSFFFFELYVRIFHVTKDVLFLVFSLVLFSILSGLPENRIEAIFDMSMKSIGSTLVIRATSAGDAGTYTCTASSEKGSAEKSVQVKVV